MNPGSHLLEGGGFGYEELTAERSGVLAERIILLGTPLRTDSNGYSRTLDASDASQSYDDLRGLWEEMRDEEVESRTKSYLERMQAVKPNPRDEATKEGVELARETYRRTVQRDYVLKNIVGKYMKSYAPLEVMNGIRLKHELRCEILYHFMNKIMTIRDSQPGILPERVRYNDENVLKSPSYQGYPVGEMSSDEYVAMLMLAMIDGSFNPSRAEQVKSHENSDGTPGYGQHREAARAVLGA